MGARYIVDEAGKRVSVVLSIEELEALEDARMADEVRAAVACGEDESVPYEQARKALARRRSARGRATGSSIS